jgi:hypothetical protein
MLLGGISDSGHPIPMTHARMVEVADQWVTTEATPDGVQSLLAVRRSLFAHSFFVYEFMAVAVHYSLLAIEAALRDRLESKAPLQRLVDRALERGLIDAAVGEQLEAARELRNDFSHPPAQSVWTVGMAAPVIRVGHEVIAGLYP